MSTDSASPFAHVLGTGFVPDTHQTAQLKSLVTNYSERLVSVKEELSKLQAKIVELETLRDGHQALLSNAIGSRPTSRDLPPDVLVHIFTHCLSTHPLPSPSISEAPLLLTRICRSWRESALSNPCLWSSIRIILPLIPNTRMYHEIRKSYENLMTRRMSGIRAWLDRSGCLPLSFSVHYGRTEYTSNQETLMFWRFMALLFDYRLRWGKAIHDFAPSVGRWDHHSITVLPPPPPVLEFPLLQEFKFRPAYLSPNVPQTHRQKWESALLQSPSLRKLIIGSGWFSPSDLLSFPVRWGHIVHLDIRSADDDHRILSYRLSIEHSTMLELLSQCSSLEFFSAAVLCPGTLPEQGHDLRTPLQLARLHTLDLHIFTTRMGSVTYRAESILDHLVVPNLRYLSLVMRGRGSRRPSELHSIQGYDRLSMDGHFIPQFIYRSDCHLISLSLRLPFLDSALFNVLDAVPELTTLELKEICGCTPEGETTSVTTEQILGWLTPDMSIRRPPALCPNLEHFTLTLGRWKRKTRNNVAAFARTWKADIDNGQQNRVGRLKSFAIRFADLQPVRQGIENVFRSDVLGYLEDWKPKSKYIDPGEIFYLD
ncbi:hypothetical protein PM082_009938 [Marasmius tenuissimus]|nr:hypothetical protein PM082_009938 [Marasmius tenuissimus]